LSEPESGDVRAGVDPRLLAFADAHRLVITCGRGGKHNLGSKHPKGEAFDFRTRGMTEEFFRELEVDARAKGLLIRDERKRPLHQKVWSGPHGHCEVV